MKNLSYSEYNNTGRMTKLFYSFRNASIGESFEAR